MLNIIKLINYAGKCAQTILWDYRNIAGFPASTGEEFSVESAFLLFKGGRQGNLIRHSRESHYRFPNYVTVDSFSKWFLEGRTRSREGNLRECGGGSLEGGWVEGSWNRARMQSERRSGSELGAFLITSKKAESSQSSTLPATSSSAPRLYPFSTFLDGLLRSLSGSFVNEASKIDST